MAGIEKKKDGRYKRTVCIHCLRHTFAVNAFRKLHNEGKDMYDEAPVLSAYMGHDSIYGTEKYLHMAAENSNDILELMNEFNASQDLFPEVDE
jgi:integrase